MFHTNTKPRILLVSATTIFGGGEVHYIKLAKLLNEHYELAAVVFNSMLQNEFENMGIRVWRGNIPPNPSILERYLHGAKCLLKALHTYKPKLIHLNGGPETFLAAIPKIFGVPIIITYHTYTNTTEKFLKRLLLSFCVKLAKKIICVSATVQSNLRDVVWANNTTVIPNWIDFKPVPNTHTLFDGTRQLSLLFIGRIETQKGIFDLLQAMKYLDNVKLDIVGEGSCIAKAIKESIGLPVTFHGFKKDVKSFYKNADLFVLPSLSEGQSLVLIEAMSSGTPCLISDIPALVETACNGQFASTYRCGDPEDMAKKIRALQEHPSSLAALSLNGQNYALAAYSEERIRPMYFNLLQSIFRA